MSVFNVAELPDVDQFAIKKGRCPWCLTPLYNGDESVGDGDHCSECGDEFVGALTVQD